MKPESFVFNYKGIGKLSASMPIGAFAFWIPCLLGSALHRNGVYDGFVYPVMAYFPFLSLLLVERYYVKLFESQVKISLSAFFMCVGIWLLGPLFIHLTFAAGDPNYQGISLITVAKETYSFPLYTFVYSTYMGPLGSLLLSTIYLLGVFALGLGSAILKMRSLPQVTH
jgi:hypothetical protein